MSKTNVTSRPATLEELTEAELLEVTGGEAGPTAGWDLKQNKSGGGVYGDGTTNPAVDAWNQLLHQYGY